MTGLCDVLYNQCVAKQMDHRVGYRFLTPLKDWIALSDEQEITKRMDITKEGAQSDQYLCYSGTA